VVKGEMRGVGSSTGAKEKHAHPGEPVLTYLHSMTIVLQNAASSPSKPGREQVSVGLHHTLCPTLSTLSVVVGTFSQHW